MYLLTKIKKKKMKNMYQRKYTIKNWNFWGTLLFLPLAVLCCRIKEVNMLIMNDGTLHQKLNKYCMVTAIT